MKLRARARAVGAPSRTALLVLIKHGPGLLRLGRRMPRPRRRVGTAGHDAALAQLEGRLTALGLEPHGDVSPAVPGRGHRLTNLIGLVPGVDRRPAPVLIAAHCDAIGRFYARQATGPAHAALVMDQAGHSLASGGAGAAGGAAAKRDDTG